MVASSLKSAKELIKECVYGRDAVRANNGILTRSGKIEHLQRDEGEAIHAYDDEVQTPQVAHTFQSAYLPLRNEGARGTLTRARDDLIALHGTQKICLKMIKFYLVEHENLFTPFAICDVFQYSWIIMMMMVSKLDISLVILFMSSLFRWALVAHSCGSLEIKYPPSLCYHPCLSW